MHMVTAGLPHCQTLHPDTDQLFSGGGAYQEKIEGLTLIAVT